MTVKKLKWEPGTDLVLWEAQTPFGKYEITANGYERWWSMPSAGHGVEKDDESAKAAAQADFAVRLAETSA